MTTTKENMRCVFWGDLDTTTGWTEHTDCGVILDEHNKYSVCAGVPILGVLPQVCPCECSTCKQSWWAAGRPTNNEVRMSSNKVPGMVYPSVGVSMVLMRCVSTVSGDEVNEVLMLKRAGPHGAGTWSFPGGHLDWGEASETAVLRELVEEVDIKVTNIFRGPYVEDVHAEEHKHMVTLYFGAWLPDGQKPVLAEPEKHTDMQWVVWGKWPQPLFRPVQTMLKVHPGKWWDRRGGGG